jgi:Leucine-rich repeat (LRR) protein
MFYNIGPQVTELNLNQNQISSLSASLAECPRLKTLRLEENCLSLAAIPTDLLTKSKVSTLCTAGNLFSEKQVPYSQHLFPGGWKP